MVEVLEKQTVNIPDAMGDLPTSEEQTGCMPDDGLPPLVVGRSYRFVTRSPENPRRRLESDAVYHGFNNQGAMVFRLDQSCLSHFDPKSVARRIQMGILEIVPTGKTRKLKK